jgi:hypothetical protein
MQAANQEMQRGPRPEKVKVPLKLSAIHSVDAELSNDSGRVPEPIVIAITSGKRTETLVVHRPIGVHKLQTTDWVITPVGEIPALLALAVDPSAQKKAVAKRKARLDRLTELGKYVKKGEELAYPADKAGGVTLAKVQQDAKAAWEMAKAQARNEYLAECEARRTKPKQDWKFGHDANHYISSGVRAIEEEYSKLLSTDTTFVSIIKKIDTPPYETMAGPYQDRPQLAVRARGNQVFTRDTIIDAIKRNLINTMNGGCDFPAVPPVTSSGPKKAGKESDDGTSQKEASATKTPPKA